MELHMGFVVDKIALPFSLVSMNASTADPVRSRTTGHLKIVVPRYIMLPKPTRIKMLIKVLGLYQSGA
jgi:hypothetical protein